MREYVIEILKKRKKEKKKDTCSPGGCFSKDDGNSVTSMKDTVLVSYGGGGCKTRAQ